MCLIAVSNHLDIGQTTVDTRKHSRHTRRLLNVYQRRQKRRILFLNEEPHHIQATENFDHFLFQKIKNGERFKHVYNMYLNLVSYGCETYFNDRNIDPMFASTLEDYNVKMKRLHRMCLAKKRLMRLFYPFPIA